MKSRSKYLAKLAFALLASSCAGDKAGRTRDHVNSATNSENTEKKSTESRESGPIANSTINAAGKLNADDAKIDFNGDGFLSLADLRIFEKAYNSKKGSDKYLVQADFDKNGEIGPEDFKKWAELAKYSFGDFDLSGTIDISIDRSLFTVAMGRSLGHPLYSPLYDFDLDGTIGHRDFLKYNVVSGQNILYWMCPYSDLYIYETCTGPRVDWNCTWGPKTGPNAGNASWSGCSAFNTQAEILKLYLCRNHGLFEGNVPEKLDSLACVR